MIERPVALTTRIEAAARAEGVDPDLFSKLVTTESSGRQSARSPKGAIGLAQLMPATAKELGVDPTDEWQNLLGGARYLKQQLDAFGDEEAALIAYNAGPANAKKWVDGGRDYALLPKREETEPYVRRILGGRSASPSVGSTLGAAFRQQNSIASAFSAGFDWRRVTADPDFDVVTELQGTRYEEFLPRLLDVDTRSELQSKLARIDMEQADKATLDAAGWGGIAAQILAGVLDPINLVPIGGGAWGVSRAANAARGAGMLALGSAASAAAQEGALHSTQMTRTGEESAWAIGTATVLGGVLGAAAGSLQRVTGKSLDDVARGLDSELSAAERGQAPLGAESAGAAAMYRTAQPGDENLVGTGGLATAVAKAPIISTPLLRVATGESDVARRVAEGLVESGGLAKVKHRQGITEGPSVEALIKQGQGELYQGLRGVDAAYTAMRKAKGGMKRQAFNEAVGMAMRRDDSAKDLAIPDAAKPHVEAAARELRSRVFDPWKERAIKAGLLPEDVEVTTAASYLTRVYNTDRIIARRPEFRQIVSDWLVGQRDKDVAKVAQAADTKGQAEQQLSAAVTRAVQELPDQAALVLEGPALSRMQMQRQMLKAIEAEADLPATIMDAGQKRKAQVLGNALRMNRTLDDAQYQELQDLHLDVFGSLPGASQDLGSQAARGVEAFKTQADTLRDAAKYAEKNSDLTGRADAQLSRAEKRVADLKALIKQSEQQAGRATELMRDLGGKGAAQGEIEAWNAFQKITDDLADAERSLGALRLASKRGRDLAKVTVQELVADLKDAAEQFDALARDYGKATRKSAILARRAARTIEGGGLAKLEDQELDDIADQIIDRILGGNPGRVPYAPIPLSRGPLKERTFNIPDKRIEAFLESDVEQVARIYTRTMAPDVELTERFGRADLADQLNEVAQEYDRKIGAATSEAEARRLQARKEDDLRDLGAMRDRLRNTYAIPDNPHGLAVRVGAAVRNLNYLRLLGGMTISAASDLARTVMVHGLMRTIGDGILPLVSNWRAVRAGVNETRVAGTALDMVLDTRANALYDIQDVYSRSTMFERGLGYASNKFGVATLMAPWNAALKQFAGLVTQARMLRAIERIGAGQDVKPREVERMARLGIDPGMARRIAEQFGTHGETVRGVRLAETADWTDAEAARAFRAALAAEVDEIIVTPGVGDKPLWMSSEAGKMVGQFKSFAIASTQRVLLSGLQRRDAAALTGALLMTALGMLSYKLKSDLASIETSNDPTDWLLEGIDRGGILGSLMEVNNIAEKLTRGNVGIRPAIGASPPTRYISRNEVGALLGPTADAAQDVLFEIPSSLTGDGWSSSDTRRVRKLVPMQNVFYMRQLFDEAERGVNTVLGVPEKRNR